MGKQASTWLPRKGFLSCLVSLVPSQPLGCVHAAAYLPQSGKSAEEGDEGHEGDGEHANGDLGDNPHCGSRYMYYQISTTEVGCGGWYTTDPDHVFEMMRYKAICKRYLGR